MQNQNKCKTTHTTLCGTGEIGIHTKIPAQCVTRAPNMRKESHVNQQWNAPPSSYGVVASKPDSSAAGWMNTLDELNRLDCVFLFLYIASLHLICSVLSSLHDLRRFKRQHFSGSPVYRWASNLQTHHIWLDSQSLIERCVKQANSVIAADFVWIKSSKSASISIAKRYNLPKREKFIPSIRTYCHSELRFWFQVREISFFFIWEKWDTGRG